MPRYHSRITLEITDIRVQRIQEITAKDCQHEGITVVGYPEVNELCEGKYIQCFKNLWNTINSKRGYSWEVNPWVWAITFKLLTPQLTS